MIFQKIESREAKNRKIMLRGLTGKRKVIF